jgi:3'-5' exoribonuclease
LSTASRWSGSAALWLSHYDGIDADLLVTGAILHDFGKIDELSYERAFGYTNEGQMIGHLVMETI